MEALKNDELSVATDSSSGTTDLSSRIDRYSKAKLGALRVSSYFKTVQAGNTEAKVCNRLENCASYLLFRHYLQTDEVRLHAAEFCKVHLLCPFCAIRRASKGLKAYAARYEVIQSKIPLEARLKPFLVTLTVKDGPNLSERWAHLHRSFIALNKRRSGKGSGSSTWTSAHAGVASYEIKRGENSGLWHPHLHAIVLCAPSPSIIPSKLSKEWKKITGDSYIVDVRPIRGDGDEVITGFMEVFKYALKFSTMESSDVIEAWRTLKGRRLLESFGLFRGVEIPDEFTDEPLEGQFIERLYKFYLATNKYELEA